MSLPKDPYKLKVKSQGALGAVFVGFILVALLVLSLILAVVDLSKLAWSRSSAQQSLRESIRKFQADERFQQEIFASGGTTNIAAIQSALNELATKFSQTELSSYKQSVTLGEVNYSASGGTYSGNVAYLAPGMSANVRVRMPDGHYEYRTVNHSVCCDPQFAGCPTAKQRNNAASECANKSSKQLASIYPTEVVTLFTAKTNMLGTNISEVRSAGYPRVMVASVTTSGSTSPPSTGNCPPIPDRCGSRIDGSNSIVHYVTHVTAQDPVTCLATATTEAVCDNGRTNGVDDKCKPAGCYNGLCTTGTISCNDSDLCTDDICDPATGNCTNKPKCDYVKDCGHGECDPLTGNCSLKLDFPVNVELPSPKCWDTDDCTHNYCGSDGNCSNPKKSGTCCVPTIKPKDRCDASGTKVIRYNAWDAINCLYPVTEEACNSPNVCSSSSCQEDSNGAACVTVSLAPGSNPGCPFTVNATPGDDPCKTSACNGSGQCELDAVNVPDAPGVACTDTDGNECTQAQCRSGVCSQSVAKPEGATCSVDDSNPCTVSGCKVNPSTGVPSCSITYTNASDGTACTPATNDSDPCTNPGCSAGTCIANYTRTPACGCLPKESCAGTSSCNYGCEWTIDPDGAGPKTAHSCDTTIITNHANGYTCGDILTAEQLKCMNQTVCMSGVCQASSNKADGTACTPATNDADVCTNPGCFGPTCIADHPNKKSTAPECQPQACTTNAECNDNKQCTDDICSSTPASDGLRYCIYPFARAGSVPNCTSPVGVDTDSCKIPGCDGAGVCRQDQVVDPLKQYSAACTDCPPNANKVDCEMWTFQADSTSNKLCDVYVDFNHSGETYKGLFTMRPGVTTGKNTAKVCLPPGSSVTSTQLGSGIRDAGPGDCNESTISGTKDVPAVSGTLCGCIHDNHCSNWKDVDCRNRCGLSASAPTNACYDDCIESLTCLDPVCRLDGTSNGGLSSLPHLINNELVGYCSYVPDITNASNCCIPGDLSKCPNPPQCYERRCNPLTRQCDTKYVAGGPSCPNDDPPITCGNGQLDPGEECDIGGGASAGCVPGCACVNCKLDCDAGDCSTLFVCTDYGCSDDDGDGNADDTAHVSLTTAWGPGTKFVHPVSGAETHCSSSHCCPPSGYDAGNVVTDKCGAWVKFNIVSACPHARGFLGDPPVYYCNGSTVSDPERPRYNPKCLP